MKQIAHLLLVAVFAGATTLGGYKYFIEKETSTITSQVGSASFTPATFSSNPNPMDLDFTGAAEKTSRRRKTPSGCGG